MIDQCVVAWNWDGRLGTKNGEKINDMVVMITVMDGRPSMGRRVRNGRTRQLFINQFDAINLNFLDYR